MKILHALPLALFLTIPGLSAQQSFESLFPSKPLMELRVKNTKTLLADLASSRIGKVVTDDALAAIGEILSGMEEWKEAVDEFRDADKEVGGLLQRLKRMVLDSDATAQMAMGMRSFVEDDFDGWMIMRLDGDKEILSELAEKLDDVLSKAEPTELGAVEILGEERPFYTGNHGLNKVALCMPFVHGDSLYLFVSSDHEKDFGGDREVKQSSLLGQSQAPVALSVDPAAVMPLLRKLAEDDMEEEVQEILELLGVFDFGRIDLTLDIKEGRLLQDFRIHIPEKGWLSEFIKTFVPSQGRGRELLHYLPDGIQVGTVGATDIRETYRLTKSLVEDIVAIQGMDGFDYEAMFEARFGFDLVKGFIDPLDGRLFRFEDLDSEGMADENASELESSTQCLSMGLKAPAAFAKSVDTVIRKMGMHVSRKKEDYRGFNLFHFKVLGMLEIHYGITDEFFLLAFGAKPAEMIRKVVDREKAIADGAKGFVPDGDLQEQLALLSDNSSALSITDIVAMASTFSEGLAQLMGDADEEGQDHDALKIMKVLVDELPGLLRKHGLRNAVTSFAREGNTLRVMSIY